MATMQEFESTLKEVVRAKRVSQSKMNKLTEIALKSMESDTQLVSILYRTHKHLHPSSKVHSLYAFDALSRAARNQVNKHGIPVEAAGSGSGKGNVATFLSKVEGVLDGLFRDMMSLGTQESKEKTKKVLDIWTKSNTFPSAVLARLANVMKDSGKEREVKAKTMPELQPQATSAPAIVPTPPIQAQAVPAAPALDHAQSALLALLAQAANAANSPQTTANTLATSAAQNQLDQNQFALLQQLAQVTQSGAVNSANAAVPPIPVPLSVVPPSAPTLQLVGPPPPPVGGVGPSAQPPRYRDDRFDYDRRGPKPSRFDPERSRSREYYYDDRREFRGGPRGGIRGGAGRGRGRWEDRDRGGYRDNYRDRDWSPPRGRSRSPPRQSRSGRRDIRPYSPPGKPSLVDLARRAGTSREAGPEGRDEFGRDIRPPSDPEMDEAPSTFSNDCQNDIQRSSTMPRSSENGSIEPNSPPPRTPSGPRAMAAAGAGYKPRGLDSFDLAGFDFTSPAAWEALGKSWNVTHGYLPSQEQLMNYVMSKSTSGAPPGPPAPQQPGAPIASQWSDERPGWGAGRGQGRWNAAAGNDWSGVGPHSGYDYESNVKVLAQHDDGEAGIPEGTESMYGAGPMQSMGYSQGIDPRQYTGSMLGPDPTHRMKTNQSNEPTQNVAAAQSTDSPMSTAMEEDSGDDTGAVGGEGGSGISVQS